MKAVLFNPAAPNDLFLGDLPSGFNGGNIYHISSTFETSGKFASDINSVLASNQMYLVYDQQELNAVNVTGSIFTGYTGEFNTEQSMLTLATANYANCTFSNVALYISGNSTFYDCKFVNCTGVFGGNFRNTNSIDCPMASVGGLNYGTLKASTNEMYFLYCMANSFTSIKTNLINNIGSIVCYGGAVLEVTGAKIFIDTNPAFNCIGSNVFLTLNNVKIKGTTNAYAVNGASGGNTTLNLNQCILDCKSAGGFTVQNIANGLYIGVTASGSVTSTNQVQNGLLANQSNLFDTIKNF